MKRLYCVLPGFLFFSMANAQIVYTDVNPDSVMLASRIGKTSSSYSLDLDNNGIGDFTLTVRWNGQARCGAECQPGSFFFSVDALPGNSVLDEKYGLSATPLDLNDSIKKNF